MLHWKKMLEEKYQWRDHLDQHQAPEKTGQEFIEKNYDN